MKKIRLGKTELMVTKTSFGALPIQRATMSEAKKILRKAYDAGINYYDTANAYSDSEEKIGAAFEGLPRETYVISTKTAGKDKKTVLAHIENSIRTLRTDYIDLLQLHNPAVLPDPEDSEGSYAGALEAKDKGYIRHIGLTNHSLERALKGAESGLYETIQFPFSYLATRDEIALAEKCRDADLGFICMKGLAGGLLNDARACFAFMQRYDWVVPIWGIQKESELDEWLALDRNPPEFTEEIVRLIEKDKKELATSFCRSCGYCMPCPVGIDIKNAARMKQFLRRQPMAPYMTGEYYALMHKIDDCLECGSCKSKCPYGLDTPNLLKENLLDYDQLYFDYINKQKTAQ